MKKSIKEEILKMEQVWYLVKTKPTDEGIYLTDFEFENWIKDGQPSLKKWLEEVREMVWLLNYNPRTKIGGNKFYHINLNKNQTK